MFIICQILNTLLLYKNAYHVHDAQKQYENTNASKKELKLTKTFSIPSFEKVKIKLYKISGPVAKNLSTKLRIVGFGEPVRH